MVKGSGFFGLTAVSNTKTCLLRGLMGSFTPALRATGAAQGPAQLITILTPRRLFAASITPLTPREFLVISNTLSVIKVTPRDLALFLYPISKE